ncbi:hypothetical protein [Alkanindiges illinoisensis]|uniref:hypothetical protein n=1 Tax=Alkanindiges illinoisensis TaxID=197183 RepID=UPI000685C6B6|nr:hypothetical protein [Alkanindiges illinoisensis]
MMTDPGFLSELEYSRKHEEEVQRLKVEAELNQFNKEKDKILANINRLENKLSKVSKNSTLIKSIDSIKHAMNTELKHPREVTLLNLLESSIHSMNLEIEKYENKLLLENALFGNIIAELAAIERAFQIYRESAYSFEKFVREPFNVSFTEVLEELRSFRKSRAIADNARTEDFYNKAVEKYTDLESIYRKYFYNGVAILAAFTLLSTLFKKYFIEYDVISTIDFWIIKGSALIIGITLITYFLKQSTRYQKLADQNYQTQVELQAYPSYIESIPTSEAAAIRKELALKYFGREIDKDSSSSNELLTDQIQASTELVKASIEIIKNVK